MKNHSSLSSMISAALAFGLYSLVASASASDIAKVRIVSAAGEESVQVDLDALKVGSSQQLVAASGKPAVVSRSADGLRIELAGRVTTVALAPVQVHELGSSDDGKQVRIIKLDGGHASHHGEHHGEHKVMVLRQHGDAEAADEVERHIDELLAEVEAGLDDTAADGNGDKVVVTREIRREHSSEVQ